MSIYKIPVSFTYSGYVSVAASSSDEAKFIVQNSFGHNGNPSFVGSPDITDWDIKLPADKKIGRPLLQR